MYSKTVNNRTGGANIEYRVVLVLVFVVPGVVLVIVEVVVSHYCYQD